MKTPTEQTPVLDAEELEALRESVRNLSAGLWPDATHSPQASLAELWRAAAKYDWTQLDDPSFFPAAIAVQEELGRAAAPLPIVDIALVGRIAQDRGAADLVAGIADGLVRPVIAQGTITAGARIRLRHVEAAEVATHALVVDEQAGQVGWFDLDGAETKQLPGLPVPAWSQVQLDRAPEWSAAVSEYPDLGRHRRLGIAARAVAAAHRSHELAVEFANQRVQFGRPIGSFQAVSHRLVNAQITLTTAHELLSHTLELMSAHDDQWQLAGEIYLEYVTERLAGLQFDAHHTLAAIGYFEEHEAPWLFRRVHADLTALSAINVDSGVGDHLVERQARLPDYERGASAARVRAEVLEAFAPWSSGPPSHLHTWDDRAREVLREYDWIGVGWPREVGGRGWPVSDVVAFSEALAYANPPLGNILIGINSIAPVVIKSAPEELRDHVLTQIRRGDLSIALGYSEPEAGSDLASLRTRAERVDGGWCINGQKLWGTSFPDSRWVVLAARTDPHAQPAHAGISLFLVDTDSPGITVSPHTSLAGDVSATTFWDDVFVPEERLLGAENAGWAVLREALAAERVLIGASVMRAHRAFERLVELASASPGAVLPARRKDLRRELGRLAVRLQGARALVNRAVRALSAGEKARAEAPMAKIAATELAEDLHATAISLLGPDALYNWGTEGAVGGGIFEDGLRVSIMGVIAGGTGDVQRNLVARAIGLPR